MTDGRRGSDVTQLHLQHTQKCLLVSPDQLQTMFFLNRKNFNKALITEHNYAATVLSGVNDISNWQQIMQLFK